MVLLKNDGVLPLKKDAKIALIGPFAKERRSLLGSWTLDGMADENDLCWLGGFPADNLKDVFGIKNEEIDTLYPDESNTVVYGEKTFKKEM